MHTPSCPRRDAARVIIKTEYSPKKQVLYDLHQRLFVQALNLMKQKNHDYASDEDPYKNFRRYGLMGILVRLSDKIARLDSYLSQGDLEVKDESVKDTILDIINYSVLFEGYRKDAEISLKEVDLPLFED